MDQVLSSHQEVEAHLKRLSASQVPQAENLASLNLVPLVWQKIESTVPLPRFSFAPVYAAAICVLILVYGLWMYQKSVVIPAKAGIQTSDSRLKHAGMTETGGTSGIVLETGGFPAGEIKSTVTKGDQFTTAEDAWLTFYFSGVGYFHLAANSALEILEARNEITPTLILPHQGGGNSSVHYKFFLEQGKLYSRLEDLEMGSVVEYQTPYATARVFGTDFLLSVNQEDGVSVEVLDGIVEVAAARVEKGRRAFISPDSGDRISVTELAPEQRMKLEEDFKRVFPNGAHSQPQRAGERPNYRILSREEA